MIRGGLVCVGILVVTCLATVRSGADDNPAESKRHPELVPFFPPLGNLDRVFVGHSSASVARTNPQTEPVPNRCPRTNSSGWTMCCKPGSDGASRSNATAARSNVGNTIRYSARGTHSGRTARG